MPLDLTAALRDPQPLIKALRKDQCERSLAAFIKQAWHVVEPGQPYTHGWHIDAIAEHLEAVTAEQIKRLLINIPPGTMKSLASSVFWPAWEWGPKNRPSTRIVATSHNLDLAIRDNQKTRRLITSDWYQGHWGDRVCLTADQNEKKKFENTATGFRQAAAFTGMTGARGDRVIIDDPHSVDSAASDAERAAVLTTFREALPTRLNNPDRSAIVVIMQRLHEEDVSGLILAEKLGYEHLMLPMEYEPERAVTTSIGFRDPRKTEGELLFPARFPREVVDRDKRVMGTYATAGQFQQRPEPKGGGILKREWWRPWTGKVFPKFDLVLAALDPAYTEKEENDPSALTIWGVYQSETDDRLMPRVLLRKAWAERLTLHDLVNKVGDDCAACKVDRLLIESKASGLSVSQELRRLYSNGSKPAWQFGVQMFDPGRQDKVARAHAVSHLFEEGMICVPFTEQDGVPDKPWSMASKVIDQCAKFPRATHDDLVDTTTMALRYLRNIGMLTRKPELDAADREAAMAPVKTKQLYPVSG